MRGAFGAKVFIAIGKPTFKALGVLSLLLRFGGSGVVLRVAIRAVEKPLLLLLTQLILQFARHCEDHSAGAALLGYEVELDAQQVTTGAHRDPAAL
jgi:hypothetical protein